MQANNDCGSRQGQGKEVVEICASSRYGQVVMTLTFVEGSIEKENTATVAVVIVNGNHADSC